MSNPFGGRVLSTAAAAELPHRDGFRALLPILTLHRYRYRCLYVPAHNSGSDLGFVIRALPNRQLAAASGSIGHVMQDLLQRLDLDYYRSALLLVARAELERLRQERAASADVQARGELPLSTSCSADSAVSPEVAHANPP
jgi:hypothetical protein